MKFRRTDGGLVPHVMRLAHMHGCWAWRANSGRAIGASGKPVRLCEPGTPDVLLVTRDGRLCGIECKSKTGKQRESQRKWEERAREFGVRYAIVRSVSDADRVLRMWAQDVLEYL